MEKQKIYRFCSCISHTYKEWRIEIQIAKENINFFDLLKFWRF